MQSEEPAGLARENVLQRPGMYAVIRSALAISISNGILKASNAILFVLVVRVLGKDAAGQFSTSTTLVAVSLGLASFGMDEMLIREAPWCSDRRSMFANFLAARCSLTFLSMLILALILELSGIYPSTLTGLIVLLSLGQIGDGVFLLCQALFVSTGHLVSVLLTSGIVSGLRIVVGLAIIYRWGGGLPYLFALYVVTSLIGAIVALKLGVNRLLELTWRRLVRLMSPKEALAWVKHGVRFFWINLFVLVEFQADVILLSILRSTSDVALYSAALTIIVAVWIVPQAYRTAIYPRLASALGRSPEAFWQFFRSIAVVSAILGVGAAIGLAMCSSILIGFLYPNDYMESKAILQILALTVFFAFASAPSSRALLTLHKESVALRLVGISTTVNILANVLLIPRLGPTGAALARASSAGLFCTLSYLSLWFIKVGAADTSVELPPTQGTAEPIVNPNEVLPKHP